jgi:putative membrane protein
MPVMRGARLLLTAALVGLAAAAARAHAPDAGPTGGVHGWSTEPLIVVPMLLLAGGYGLGIVRLWRRAGLGRGIPLGRALAFVGGYGALVAALLSPLDAAAETSFSLHMAQHMLLIVVAAPLLALASVGVALLTALPARVRVPVGRTFAAGGRLRRLRDGLTAVALATALHGLVIWAWHAPVLYQAALEDDLVHWLEHLTMLGSAVLFWWSAISGGRGQALGRGAGVAALFLAMLHTGFMGILITLAPQPLYEGYLTVAPFGLTALEDQQLAGIVMLVPGGLAYLLGGLALLAAWLNAAERRHPSRDRRELTRPVA